eukprot:scaffold129021_cov35-Tisochrysis_lutea.AAC.2
MDTVPIVVAHGSAPGPDPRNRRQRKEGRREWGASKGELKGDRRRKVVSAESSAEVSSECSGVLFWRDGSGEGVILAYCAGTCGSRLWMRYTLGGENEVNRKSLVLDA